MAFTFKPKRRPNALQLGLAHFAKGFMQGKTAALQQQFEMQKKNEAVIKQMDSVVSQMWSQIQDPAMKSKVNVLRMIAKMGNYKPNEYLQALVDTEVFDDKAFAPFAEKLGFTLKADTRPTVETTEVIAGEKVTTKKKGRNGDTLSITKEPMAKKTFKKKKTSRTNGTQIVTEFEYDTEGNIVSERVVSEKPVEKKTYTKKITSIEDGMEIVTEHIYDLNGNLISERVISVKPVAEETFKKKVTSRTNGTQIVTEYEYDTEGNIVSERVVSEKPVAGSLTVINKNTGKKEKIFLNEYLDNKDNYDIPKNSFDAFLDELYGGDNGNDTEVDKSDQEIMDDALNFKRGRLGSPSSPKYD